MNHDPMLDTPSGAWSDDGAHDAPPPTTADVSVTRDVLAQAGDLALRTLTSREFAAAVPAAPVSGATPDGLAAISGEYRRRVRDEGVVHADRWLAGALGLGPSGLPPSARSGLPRRNRGA
ncbi:hypothetical protein ACQQ2N_05695 [Dokdonella sp. MW10]|uniref:hypothetical protein n=1 Tax=Dokdonella sp. MW10 TaxID=2992926 RepID=UPI003F80FF20